jgi:hypothetical protein
MPEVRSQKSEVREDGRVRLKLSARVEEPEPSSPPSDGRDGVESSHFGPLAPLDGERVRERGVSDTFNRARDGKAGLTWSDSPV